MDFLESPQEGNSKTERNLWSLTQQQKLTLTKSSLTPNLIPRWAYLLMEWELPLQNTNLIYVIPYARGAEGHVEFTRGIPTVVWPGRSQIPTGRGVTQMCPWEASVSVGLMVIFSKMSLADSTGHVQGNIFCQTDHRMDLYNFEEHK
jgi:hypothetical protein